MEYVPNPTFEINEEDKGDEDFSNQNINPMTDADAEKVIDGRPGRLTVKLGAGGRLSDNSPSPRTPISEKRSKSWYYAGMYPSHKTRRKEFKSLFPMVGTETRFVVDFSCAYHKDILHQGRMYVTSHFCCFYSYIFGWEQKVVIDWREVDSITKEKTAIFIPNAIQLTLNNKNKYFFASFVERDNSFMLLFTLWQAVLTGQPLPDEEIDQIIATQYGEGDDDEVDSECEDHPVDGGNASKDCNTSAEVPSSVEAIFSKWQENSGNIVCDKIFPKPINQIYRLLYTNDNFYFNFQKERGTTELEIGDWETEEQGEKAREVRYNMALNNPVGPKTCQVKEMQSLSQNNVEDKIYCIETVAENSGVPYADSFSVVTRSCLIDVGKDQTKFVAKAEIKFKKDLWGFLKDKIETNAWSGIKSYYSSLSEALESYSENAPQKASLQTKQIRAAKRTNQANKSWAGFTAMAWNILTQPLLLYFVMLFLFVTSVMNTIILYQLTTMSDVGVTHPEFPPLPPTLKHFPTDQAGWLELLSKQSESHSLRSAHLREQLLAATKYISKAEEALINLKDGLDKWEPYVWIDDNCVTKDGKLVCDKMDASTNNIPASKDEM